MENSNIIEAMRGLESAEDIERINPKALQGIVQLAQLGQLVKMRKEQERRKFQGVIDEVTLNANQVRDVVDISNRPGLKGGSPWISCAFFNDGPNTCYVGINNQSTFFTMRINESHPTDFSDSVDRINKIYFWCDPGQTASVRAKGKY
jgi:hypothetical protein